MKKYITYSLLAISLLISFSFLNPPKEKVQWMSFAEMQAAYAIQPRPILVDLYTDWCGWCKVMEKSTYGNEKVAAYINQNYYAVKFNAESKEAIDFNGKKYEYNASMKTNDLALHLSFGDRSYPNTVFLGSLTDRPAPLAGYLKPKELEGPLRYFAERKGEETFVEFNQKMKGSW
jgi:uncharacterized protein YyaL (SSP411 family)